MTTKHPITPPPELVAQIRREALHGSEGQLDYELRLIHDAYRAGADMELEACCEWLALHYPHVYTTRLKRCRRPKPKSLAEQKQAIHDEIHQLLAQISASNAGALAVAEPIRAALKRLRELEGNQ